MSPLIALFTACLEHFVQFWVQDVYDIFALAADALRNAKQKLPSTMQGLKSLNTKELVTLLPLCTVVLFITCTCVRILYSGITGSAISEKGGRYRRVITTAIIVRVMGFIYLFAFLSNAYQFKALYGSHGLASITEVQSVRPSPVFSYLGLSDSTLEIVSWSGVLLSALMLITPLNRKVNFLIPLLLWLAYLSIVNLGVGYIINYGWEWLTLEIGFLVIFLCPLLNEDIPETNITIVFWLLKWSAFRLMFGAGMSKMGLGSSQCWKDLECLLTHYETQPMPNPISFYFHHFPVWFHKVEGVLVLLEQIIFPFLLFSPSRRVQRFLCVSELFLMCGIAGTGNYAWINFLGFLPFLSCLDDDFILFRYLSSYYGLSSTFSAEREIQMGVKRSEIQVAAAYADNHYSDISPSIKDMAQHQQQQASTGRIRSARTTASTDVTDIRTNSRNSEVGGKTPSFLARSISKIRVIISTALFVVIMRLSVNPVKELFANQPWLHFYDDYFLVNANGLFGFVNAERIVLTLEYSTQDLSSTKGTCKDSSQPIGQDQTGKSLFCAEVSDYCGKNAQVDTLCKSSCGKCFSSKSISSMNWTSIEFQNLPGSPKLRPKFTSPYHYRFDWQVWIETTASMEGQNPSGWVPPFLRRATGKLLFDDKDVKTLFSNGNSIPSSVTAIKSTYYRYKFTNESVFSLDTDWWQRELFKDSVRIWTKDSFGSGKIETAMNELGVVTKESSNYYQSIILSIICIYVLTWYHINTSESKNAMKNARYLDGNSNDNKTILSDSMSLSYEEGVSYDDFSDGDEFTPRRGEGQNKSREVVRGKVRGEEQEEDEGDSMAFQQEDDHFYCEDSIATKGDKLIRVVVRKRPISRQERARNERDAMDIEPGGKVFVHQPKLKVDQTRIIESQGFVFDDAFDYVDNNLSIYNRTVKPLVHTIFTGGKATCFAYGQTGAGKTFTMMGSRFNSSFDPSRVDPESTGLYVLAANDIFQILIQPQFQHLKAFLSCFEIYGGKLFDLLNDKSEVMCLEDSRHQVQIKGLSEHEIISVESLLQTMRSAFDSRAVGSTGANSESSRSHMIMQIELREHIAKQSLSNVGIMQKQKRVVSADAGAAKTNIVGKLSFIDLAGSERGADTISSSKQTRLEGSEINTSLLALKEVIRSLNKKADHTSFRASKLTQVLKDSFVDKNTRTCMIACVSPSSGNCIHTLNTLRYADRVKEHAPIRPQSDL